MSQIQPGSLYRPSAALLSSGFMWCGRWGRRPEDARITVDGGTRCLAINYWHPLHRDSNSFCVFLLRGKLYFLLTSTFNRLFVVCSEPEEGTAAR